MDNIWREEVENINIRSTKSLITPNELKKLIPETNRMKMFVSQSRNVVRNILSKDDPRLMVIVGPCSIHDPVAALDYAKRLKELAHQVSGYIYIVMRVYFEKPRTVFGWKGLINDPHLDDTFEINEGLIIARKLLTQLAEYGVPAATESLDPITPQYIQDLITWTAIGARTTESQTHREMASGLSSSVGFKNSTDGSLDTAINAIKSSAQAHSFLGICDDGRVSIVNTTGKNDTHIVLRGSNGKPNYDCHNVYQCEQALISNNIDPVLMIDCSHENSGKNHLKQLFVLQNILQQILSGNRSIRAIMLEGNIGEGNQTLTGNKADLKYGTSITDKCLGWEMTYDCITDMHDKLRHMKWHPKTEQKWSKK